MCGICGVFGRSDQDSLQGMMRVLTHRGPDDEHSVSDQAFSLGTRRLGIIDLEGGRQPLANENQDIWVVQNGEIYNYVSLMKKLKGFGHHFLSRSDTEVLVHLYEEKGQKFLEEIDGMFAIALWDNRKKKGMLARDRVGKKPLYYHITQTGALYFSSEIKGLLSLPFFKKKIHRPALHHFLSYKHVPAPLTIYEGIFALPPAHQLIYRIVENGKATIEIERYWQLDFSQVWTEGLSEDEIVDTLLDSLQKSVEKRLVSDVPVGTFLSGGVDSGLCTALAAMMSPQPIQTFTLAYGDQDGNPAKERDRRFAAIVAKRYQTHHHEAVIDPHHLEEDLSDILGHFDEPFGGVISTYFLARLISQEVKVAISGDGADEIFGSYLSHRLAIPIHDYTQGGKKGVPDSVALLNQNDQNILKQIADEKEWRWRYRLFVFSDEEKYSLYSEAYIEALGEVSTQEHLKSYFGPLSALDPLNRILEAEFNSQLPDQVLTFVDRLSMAHSLEVRAPYLDTDFLKLAAGVESAWKIRKGETKYILKKAGLRYLPKELVFQPKEGFLMPINQWLLTYMGDYVRELLSPSRLDKQGIFNSAYIQILLERFYQGNAFLGAKLWLLIVFQIWHDRYMDRFEVLSSPL